MPTESTEPRARRVPLAPPVRLASTGSSWLLGSSGTTYNLNDAVFYNGSSYVSLQGSNTGNEPDTSASFWSLLAQQGARCATGAAGSKESRARPAQPALTVQLAQPGRVVPTESTEPRARRVQLAPPVRLASLAVRSLVFRYHLQPERRRCSTTVRSNSASLQGSKHRNEPATPRPPSGRCWRATRCHWRNRSRGFERSRGRDREPALTVQLAQPGRVVPTESTEPRARRVQLAPPVRLASTGSPLLGLPVPPTT